MIKETNKQRSVVLSKELDDKLIKEAKANYFGSTNQLIRKILIEYFRNKENA